MRSLVCNSNIDQAILDSFIQMVPDLFEMTANGTRINHAVAVRCFGSVEAYIEAAEKVVSGFSEMVAS